MSSERLSQEDIRSDHALVEGYVSDYTPYKDVKFDTHTHTEWGSDGGKLHQTVKEAIRSGLDLIAITDHDDYENTESLKEFVIDPRKSLSGHPYIDGIKDYDEDTDGIEVLVGLEINYETNQYDRDLISKRLNSEGFEPLSGPYSDRQFEDIEQVNRELANSEELTVSNGSVHDVDGTYVKKESEVLQKIHEDYLEQEWNDIDDIEEVDNEKIQRINQKIDLIREEFVDIYFDKIQKLAEDDGDYKFICHPDLIMRNSVLKNSVTEDHIDDMVTDIKESDKYSEINGKGLVRQPREKIEEYIEDTENYSMAELVEKMDEVIFGTEDKAPDPSMIYLRKLAEHDVPITFGSDSHRAIEPVQRGVYFSIIKALDSIENLNLDDINEYLGQETNQSEAPMDANHNSLHENHSRLKAT